MHFLTFLKMSKILRGSRTFQTVALKSLDRAEKPTECFQYQFFIGSNRQSASLTDVSIAARKAGKSKSLQVVDGGRCCRD